MLRFVFISSLLLSVLTIGIPFADPVGEFSYVFWRRFGLDVSMTPITFDMSMMTDDKGNLVYQKAFNITVYPVDGDSMVLSTEELDFYHHKVPMNLYFEILGYGGSMPEGRTFLCLSLGELAGRPLKGFMLSLKQISQKSKGFNELQKCF